METQQKTAGEHLKNWAAMSSFNASGRPIPWTIPLVDMANSSCLASEEKRTDIVVRTYDTLPFPLEDKIDPRGCFSALTTMPAGWAVRNWPTTCQDRRNYGILISYARRQEFSFPRTAVFFLGSEYFAAELVDSREYPIVGAALDMMSDKESANL